MKFIGHKFILGVGLAMIAMFGLLFFSPNSALAAITITPLTVDVCSGGTWDQWDPSGFISSYCEIDIPAHSDNSILVCQSTAPDYYNTGFIFNSATSTTLFGASGAGINYSVNPQQGNNQAITIHSGSRITGTGNSVIKCFLFDGVNTSQPLVSTTGTPYSSNYNDPRSYLYTATKPDVYIFSVLDTGDKNRQFADTSITQSSQTIIEAHNGVYNGLPGGILSYEQNTHGIEPFYITYSGGIASEAYFTVYEMNPSGPSKTPLEMKTVEYEPLSGIVVINGTCSQYGSGINQMQVVGVADDATSTPPVYPDPWGIERGGLISCNDDDTFSAIYNGEGMTGSHYIAIDDTFFGTEWASIQVNFDATSTAMWSKDAIYGTDDSQETAKKMACTNEEWASDNIITKTKCRVGQAIYIAMFSTRDKAKEYSTGLITTFKNTFPFNLSNFVQETWKKSETAELPNNLQFLNFSDSNGDINIPVKIGTATSTIPIFGKSIFQNDDSKDAYEKIRDVSTWVFRGLVIIYAFMIGIKIYHELNGSKHQE